MLKEDYSTLYYTFWDHISAGGFDLIRMTEAIDACADIQMLSAREAYRLRDLATEKATRYEFGKYSIHEAKKNPFYDCSKLVRDIFRDYESEKITEKERDTLIRMIVPSKGVMYL